MRKKIVISILSLAVISLACLDTSAVMVSTVEPSQVATRFEAATATAAPTVTVTQTEAPAGATCAEVIASSAQNLRVSADVNSKVLQHLKRGDLVQVINGPAGDWWLVEYDGSVGYARSIYLQVVECEVSNEY